MQEEEILQYILDVKCQGEGKDGVEYVVLNRVVEIGSQTVIWERAFQAEEIAKAIKQEQVCQV